MCCTATAFLCLSFNFSSRINQHRRTVAFALAFIILLLHGISPCLRRPQPLLMVHQKKQRQFPLHFLLLLLLLLCLVWLPPIHACGILRITSREFPFVNGEYILTQASASNEGGGSTEQAAAIYSLNGRPIYESVASPKRYLYHMQVGDDDGGRWLIGGAVGVNSAWAFSQSWATAPNLIPFVSHRATWRVFKPGDEQESEPRGFWKDDYNFRVECLNGAPDSTLYIHSVLSPMLTGMYTPTAQVIDGYPVYVKASGGMHLYARRRRKKSSNNKDASPPTVLWILGEEAGKETGLAFIEEAAVTSEARIPHEKEHEWEKEEEEEDNIQEEEAGSKTQTDIPGDSHSSEYQRLKGGILAPQASVLYGSVEGNWQVAVDGQWKEDTGMYVVTSNQDICFEALLEQAPHHWRQNYTSKSMAGMPEYFHPHYPNGQPSDGNVHPSTEQGHLQQQQEAEYTDTNQLLALNLELLSSSTDDEGLGGGSASSPSSSALLIQDHVRRLYSHCARQQTTWEILRIYRVRNKLPRGGEQEQNLFFELNNGVLLHKVGFGSGATPRAESAEALARAFSAGYRLVDTATAYDNEDLIGDLLVASSSHSSSSTSSSSSNKNSSSSSSSNGASKSAAGPRRDNVFLISKLWYSELGFNNTLEAVGRSLMKLRTDYLDGYLIHWPKCDPGIEWMDCSNLPENLGTWQQSWRALERLYAEGRILSIGVSNFNAALLQEALDISSTTPAIVQNHRDVVYQDDEVVELCKRHGIMYQAYSSLRTIMSSSHWTPAYDEARNVLALVAAIHQKSISQVALRWEVQQNHGVIPRSSSMSHLVENLDIYNFELNEFEMVLMSALTIVGKEDEENIRVKEEEQRYLMGENDEF